MVSNKRANGHRWDALFIADFSKIRQQLCGLHPDGYEDAESGWPRVLRRFAAEAWRRADVGEMTDAELYATDAAWSGLYDRMFPHKPDEMDRRLALAADHGEAA
jgi:hypothetical protein